MATVDIVLHKAMQEALQEEHWEGWHDGEAPSKFPLCPICSVGDAELCDCGTHEFGCRC